MQNSQYEELKQDLTDTKADVAEIKEMLQTIVSGDTSIYVRLNKIELVLENVNYIKKAIVEGGVKVVASILAAMLVTVLGGGVMYLIGKGVN